MAGMVCIKMCSLHTANYLLKQPHLNFFQVSLREIVQEVNELAGLDIHNRTTRATRHHRRQAYVEAGNFLLIVLWEH